MNLGADLRGAGRYLALGVQMVVVTMVGAGVGYWLDRRTGCEPWFLAAFFLLGALGGIAVVWRALYEPHQGQGDKR